MTTTNTLIEEKIANLRELHLDTSPDEDGLKTRSITMSLGTFTFEQKVDQAAFYLLSQQTLEDWLRQAFTSILAEQQAKNVEALEGLKLVFPDPAKVSWSHDFNQAIDKAIDVLRSHQPVSDATLRSSLPKEV